MRWWQGSCVILLDHSVCACCGLICGLQTSLTKRCVLRGRCCRWFVGHWEGRLVDKLPLKDFEERVYDVIRCAKLFWWIYKRFTKWSTVIKHYLNISKHLHWEYILKKRCQVEGTNPSGILGRLPGRSPCSHLTRQLQMNFWAATRCNFINFDRWQTHSRGFQIFYRSLQRYCTELH